jgi:hypothetical protein
MCQHFENQNLIKEIGCTLKARQNYKRFFEHFENSGVGIPSAPQRQNADEFHLKATNQHLVVFYNCVLYMFYTLSLECKHNHIGQVHFSFTG